MTVRGGLIREHQIACRTDALEAISKLLSAPVKLYTSRCVLRELHALGPDLKGGAVSRFHFDIPLCTTAAASESFSVVHTVSQTVSGCNVTPHQYSLSSVALLLARMICMP